MSDDKDQKTHAPSPKKLEDARRRGEVAIAPEIRHAMLFIALAIAFYGPGAWGMERLLALCVRLWGGAERALAAPDAAMALATGLVAELALALAPLFALFLIAAIAALFAQGRPTIAWQRVSPKWSKLSPAKGLARLFGPQALIEFLKTLAKFGAVALIAALIAAPAMKGADRLIGAPPAAIASLATGVARQLVVTVMALVLAIALFDLFWQRHSFLRKMRMSLKELKDEHKEQEGDPLIKGQIRRIARQRSQRRMMAALPDAAVIITNPTHYAVALKYEQGQDSAPVVVAKGVDAVALKIREVAEAAGVPIVESPPLARSLHAMVDIDQPIRTEHYAAVAEIIGYVLKLAREKGPRR